jgi:hypothetical protein
VEAEAMEDADGDGDVGDSEEVVVAAWLWGDNK